LLVRSLTIYEQRLGTQHPTTQQVLENFRSLLQEAIAAEQTTQLSNHPLTQNVLQQLSNSSE
jgi:hypothetical protein